MVINARTDALAVNADRDKGIEEAIMRGKMFLRAGADLVFVTSVATPEEAKRVVEGIGGPVSIAVGMPYNIQTLSIAQVRNCGAARASLPAILVFSAIQAMKQTLASIHDNDTFEDILEKGLLCSPVDLSQVLSR